MQVEEFQMVQLESAAQIASCYRVMQQLRPHLIDCQKFVDQVQRQLADGYSHASLCVQNQPCSLIGYRYLEFLAWGKVLYIDDLISSAEHRQKGYAGQLLNWVIEQAKIKGCHQVHLDSGPLRHDAHRLYLNSGFKIIGHHLALEL